MLTVRPKVADLEFQLYGRSLHPELFEIHKSRCIDRGNFLVKVDITTDGHVVTWRYDGMTLAEVASSAHQPLPKKRRLMHCKLKGERKDRVECRGGIIYQMNFRLESVPPEKFWHYHEEFHGLHQHEGLLCRFDSSGRVALGAISYVNVETRSRVLRIRAVHTFPDDYAIVSSESHIEIP